MGFFDSAMQLSPINQLFGADTLGDMATGGAISNAKSVAQTNDMQMNLANQQMGFQERMSNSAYQRAVDDMRKAGLNPALAYQNGGASTPTGAMASLTAPRKGDIGAGLFNTAKAIATGLPEIEQTKSQTQLNHANALTSEAQSQKLTANARESAAQTEYVKTQNQRARYDVERSKADSESAKRENELQRQRFETDKKLAPIKPYLEMLGQAAGTANSAVSTYKNLTRPQMPQWPITTPPKPNNEDSYVNPDTFNKDYGNRPQGKPKSQFDFKTGNRYYR